jgi:hypothetical protein
MDAISQNIKDAFDSIGLILVFIFVLFDIQYPKIIKDLNKETPLAERSQDVENYRSQLFTGFMKNSFPMIFVNCSVLYLLLPLTIKVLQTSPLKLWEFDFLRTSLIFVFLFVSFFFIWSVYLGGSLIKKISDSYRLRKK